MDAFKPNVLTENDITSLLEGFETCTIPESAWTHEAHLLAAVWYILAHRREKAFSVMKDRIIRFNEAVGTPNTDHRGYHETLTWFWIISVSRFLQTGEYRSLVEACVAVLSSDLSRSTFPLDFYSRDLLLSVKARREWVEPDLKMLEPFPGSPPQKG